jgi:glucose-6-phosphate 1-dehydrogenase
MVDPRLVPEPFVFILFGATGELAHRLMFPSFFRLAQAGLLPSDWRIVGNGRGDVSHEDFRGRVRDSLETFGPKPSEGPWDDFSSKLRFAGGGFDADNPGSLLDVIDTARAEMGKEVGKACGLIHYLAVPPNAFSDLTAAIGTHGLAKGSRIVYEKPFGTSKESFQELDQAAHDIFDESQIYRIDHFLGKEATQDVHLLRFANGLFSRAWDHRHISSVQIDVPETDDVSARGSFYDATGASLDMIVTHLFQLAAEVAMEPPHTFGAEHVSVAREGVISSFRPIARDDVVLGQYEGYRDTEGVAPDSRTETFTALRLWIDNDRWRGVPFFMRTGKCLARSGQRVNVEFRSPTGHLIDALGHNMDAPEPGNVLSFDLVGDGAINLRMVAKKPGVELTLAPADADLPLGKAFHTSSLPAYARLIHDVMMGDRSLFTRPDGLAHVWDVSDALLTNKPDPIAYPKGSWGPPEAAALVAPDKWRFGQ